MPTISEYRSPKTLSYLAIGSLAGVLVINVLNILLGFGELVAPHEFEDFDGATYSPWLTLMNQFSLFEIVFRLAAMVFFLMWLFRIFKNLAPTRIRNSETPPGWAIGYWFIPFANLFLPHRVMQQAWRDTDPDSDPLMGFVTYKESFNTLILIWWLTFIGSNIVVRIVTGKFVQELPIAQVVLAIMIAGFIVSAAALMAIMIVWEITERQEKRAEKISAFDGVDAPPPPPTFG